MMDRHHDEETGPDDHLSRLYFQASHKERAETEMGWLKENRSPDDVFWAIHKEKVVWVLIWGNRSP